MNIVKEKQCDVCGVWYTDLHACSPVTLSGIPRVEGVAPETPAQDVRNAMTLLSVAEQWTRDFSGKVVEQRVQLDREDFDAIWERLNRAVAKLESR